MARQTEWIKIHRDTAAHLAEQVADLADIAAARDIDTAADVLRRVADALSALDAPRVAAVLAELDAL